MSLLLIEGYEDGLPVGRHQSASTNATSTGRSGAGTSARSTVVYQIHPADESTTVIVGGAYKWDGTDSRDFLHLRTDGGSSDLVILRFKGTGQIEIRTGGGGVFGTTTKPNPLIPNVWYYIELKVLLASGATGTIDIHVDEVSVFSASGIQTKYGGTKTTFDNVFWSCFDTYNDDLYVCNSAGSVNNTFLGDCYVQTLFPSGNGNSSVLVGSDGNSTDNYLLVDEATADSADYVGSGTTGDKDTYAFQDTTLTGTVKGVQVNVFAAKTDAGARTARPVVRSGGTDYAGADVSLSTTYADYDQVWETDPATSAAWAISAVNAAEFGFEVRS